MPFEKMKSEELRAEALALYADAAAIHDSEPIWRNDVIGRYFEKYAEALAVDMAFRDAQAAEWRNSTAKESQ